MMKYPLSLKQFFVLPLNETYFKLHSNNDTLFLISSNNDHISLNINWNAFPSVSTLSFKQRFIATNLANPNDLIIDGKYINNMLITMSNNFTYAYHASLNASP